MTRDSIIELADQWTERKGKQFNLQKMYEFAVAHVCKQNRFWWRKKLITFNMVIGTTTYDLTSITTTPALTETGIEEVIKWELVITPGTNPSIVKLTPIFDDEAIFTMLENTTNGQPSRYTMGVDAFQTLRVDPPDSAYKTRMSFWAMPSFADDSTNTIVPMVPAWHHNAIVECMAAQIFENVYGLQDVKTMTMQSRYQKTLTDMQMRPEFTTDYVQTLATQEDAVQST